MTTSKKISQLPAKATLDPNDVIPILDSAEDYVNKKVLASSIASAGNVHLVTITNYDLATYTFTGTSPDVAQYEESHLYIFRVPDVYPFGQNQGNLTINSLPTRLIYGDGGSMPPYSLKPGGYAMLLFNAEHNRFRMVCTLSDDIVAKHVGRFMTFFADTVYANTYYADMVGYTRLDQVSETSTETTPTYDIQRDSSSNKHITYTNPLVSLTLTGYPRNQPGELEFQFTTGSTFAFTAANLVGKWIGIAAPTFDPNTLYIICIKNGYAVLGKVGA